MAIVGGKGIVKGYQIGPKADLSGADFDVDSLYVTG